MEVSKVHLSTTTLSLNRLNKVKKTALRRKLVVEHIQSKPAGEIIRTGEFREVCQFSTDANTHSFIKRMLRDGVIARYKGDKPKTYYYTVLGSVRVRKPEEKQPETDNAPVTKNHSLIEYAKQFAWEHNSDSLREFVAYMDGKELELRRLSD